MTGVAVGEKHSLALQSWCEAPSFHAASAPQSTSQAFLPEASQSLGEGQPDSFASRRAELHALTSNAYWAELDLSLEEGLPNSDLMLNG